MSKDHNAVLESAWKKGFEKRNGPAVLDALKKYNKEEGDKALQEFIDNTEGIGDAVVTVPEIVVRCVEDRLEICGCGCAGCGVLVQDRKTGKPRVPSIEEMADNILNAPAVKDSEKPVIIVEHEECGANRMALAAIKGVDPDSLSQEEVNEFGGRRGQELVDTLNRKFIASGSKRRAYFKEVNIGTKEMPGPKGGHPGESIYITDFAGDRVLKPDFQGLPQGMHINPRMFANKGDFILHVQTGVKILTGPHGAGHKPIMIIGCTEDAGRSPEVRALIEEAIRDLPEEMRADVIIGAAEIKAHSKKAGVQSGRGTERVLN